MTLPISTRIRSIWGNKKIEGVIVGYGAVCWPVDSTGNLSDDEGVMHSVYLIQVRPGSSGLGPACAVLRSDRVEEVV